MTPQLTILSLGWGVQSWTLAAMSALGELPKVDYAIHADTTWEREETYTFAAQWTPWLEERGIKVITVQGKRSHVPVHQSQKSGARYILIPAFTVNEAGSLGQVRRQCTGDWKIDPQDKEMRAIMKRLGIKKTEGVVEKWLGISMDEWQRAKPSKLPYVTHRYPLLEQRITRHACVLWLKEQGLPVPPKSACVFCPFHSNAAWQEMKRRGGSDWEVALQVDEQIRNVRADEHATKPAQLFVHAARRPLADAVTIPEDFGYEQASLLPVEDDELATCDSGHCFL